MADSIIPARFDTLTLGSIIPARKITPRYNDTGSFGNLRYDLAADYRFELTQAVQLGVNVSGATVCPARTALRRSMSREPVDFLPDRLVSARYGRTAQRHSDISGAFLSVYARVR